MSGAELAHGTMCETFGAELLRRHRLPVLLVLPSRPTRMPPLVLIVMVLVSWGTP
jgi:hypothetical protein